MLKTLDESAPEADQSCDKTVFVIFFNILRSFLFPLSYFSFHNLLLNWCRQHICYDLIQVVFGRPWTSQTHFTPLDNEQKRSFSLDFMCSRIRCCTSSPQIVKCFITPADSKYLIPLLNWLKGKTENTVSIVVELQWVPTSWSCGCLHFTKLLALWVTLNMIPV